MIDWYGLTASLSQFHFLRPWWLILFPIVVIAVMYLKRNQNNNNNWQQTIAPHLFTAMLVPRNLLSWFNPVNIGVVLLAGSCIILAGPTWQQQPSPLVQDEAVTVVVLDLSYSMEQQDIQPSRLERAKHKITDLLQLRGDANTALVVFSGSAHTVVPLTNDNEVLHNFLSVLNTEMMPQQGKNPEKVLPVVAGLLAEVAVPSTVLLISDDISASAEAAFNSFFAASNDQLLVLGVGTEEQSTEQAGKAFFPLNTTALTRLANSNNGSYQQITIDDTDVTRLYRRIDSYLSTVADDARPWLDVGYYLLFPIALFLLLWFRKGWAIHWCVMLVLVVGSGTPATAQADQFRFADWWLTPDQQGYYYFQQGDYETAALRFTDPVWRGMAYYYAEDFPAAINVWSAIETDQGLFNLANAWAQSQNYVYAVKVYDVLLRRKPEFPGAKKNRKMVQDIIDEINRMSESQSSEEGEGSKELGEQPLKAQGAERNDTRVAKPETFTAEQILANEKIQQMWLRQVQKDPSEFLAVKFAMQLSNSEPHENRKSKENNDE